MASSSEKVVQLLIQCGELVPFCFSIVAVDRTGQPLIYVNAAFKSLTQYTEGEVLGKNCRFLQGPATDPVACARIGKSIKERRAVFQDLVNYKKDGTPFLNRLVLLPIDTDSEVFYFGLQHDLSPKSQDQAATHTPLSYPSAQVSTRELAHWIKNRFNLAFLNLQFFERSKNEGLIQKVRKELETVSSSIWSFS